MRLEYEIPGSKPHLRTGLHMSIMSRALITHIHSEISNPFRQIIVYHRTSCRIIRSAVTDKAFWSEDGAEERKSSRILLQREYL